MTTYELSSVAHQDACNAWVLDDDDPADRNVLAELRADPRIEFIDRRSHQAAAVRELLPTPGPELLAEPMRWAYYPWRRTVVGVLGPRAFRAVRLDRNRNLITAGEQAQLSALRVGVAGLSVGHVIAHTLAMEGLCGELWLADFDHLELSNLNRVPATLLDLGVNKATVAARRIAEIDPYLRVRVMTSGVTSESLDTFLDGLDIVVEECDSLDIKALVREAARTRRLPVLMATTDRGLVDIERFDLEPERPILHGLIGEVSSALLAGMTARDKIPYLFRHLDVGQSSSRATASMVEVGRTLSTWPQLAGDVVLGATAVAEAVRRIGLGEALPSGRVRFDIAEALGRLEDPVMAGPDSQLAAQDDDAGDPGEQSEDAEFVAGAAIRAPSGGNSQPWQVVADHGSIDIRIAPEYTSAIDVGLRGSAVAVGAAVFNARVAAAWRGILGPVEFEERSGEPLRAILRFGGGDDPDLARQYRPMLLRETNRHKGARRSIDAATIEILHDAARREGARLQLLTDQDDIESVATILAAADRARYLTPRLHADMAAELRWPGDPAPESGIDVLSLELDSSELTVLKILRRPEVMAHLAQWDAGASLGDDSRDRVRASSAVAVVSVQGRTLTDYARGGSAVEAVWIAAQQRGLAVQPVSPVFLHAHTQDELDELSPTFASSLDELQRALRELARTPPDESQVLILRLCAAPPTSVRSRRRSLDRMRAPSH